MLPTFVPSLATNAAIGIGRPRRPPVRGVVGVLAGVLLLALTSTTLSTFAYLQLPSPTGDNAVGRVDTLLSDASRTDPRTGDARGVRVIAWYPAIGGTGSPADYVPGYATIRSGLEASQEITPLAVAGLGLVRPAAREGAALVDGADALPVIVLEPGNATNVAFYGSLAEDLASHGYVVIGVDHPFQVGAVDLGGGRVAVYPGDAPTTRPAVDVAAKIDERLADLAFVLDRLASDRAGLPSLSGRLALDRVGVVGHSNGGIAAAEACETIARVAACVNIDGQAAGGPFSARPDPTAPSKPFLFLTKETVLHPALGALFEAAGAGTYRVVVPAAAHSDFADGARFHPRLIPTDTTIDAVLAVERGFTLAFFDHALRGAPQEVFGTVNAPTDVLVNVYPLERRPG